MKKSIFLLLSFILLLGILSACGKKEEANNAPVEQNKKELVFGATAGPYSDMVTKALKPLLEEKGYKIDLVEFSDYVQPNLSLSNGELDANLFQHKVYYEAFAKEHNLDLSEVIIVPTAPMGVYSNKFEDLKNIADGSTIAVANDPTNLARTLLMLQEAGLITISDDIEPLKASEKDIADNPKNLKFEPIEAAQLPRAVDSVDIACVPGNYALAAKMDLLDALYLENMPDDYRNRVVVNTKDLETDWVKDIKAVVESDEFEKIIDESFKGFGKPQWMLK